MLMLTGGNTGPQTGNTCLPLATTPAVKTRFMEVFRQGAQVVFRFTAGPRGYALHRLSIMNVPLTDSLGLCIYRELMHREQNALATWHLTYGPEAINKAPNPDSMLNMGKFSKISSMPMPLSVQLQSVKAERRAQSAKITRYERSIYPQRSDVPVSESSVKIFGNAAWHSQVWKAGRTLAPSYCNRPSNADMPCERCALAAQEEHWGAGDVPAIRTPTQPVWDEARLGRGPHSIRPGVAGACVAGCPASSRGADRSLVMMYAPRRPRTRCEVMHRMEPRLDLT